jgi:hypothetical protein
VFLDEKFEQALTTRWINPRKWKLVPDDVKRTWKEVNWEDENGLKRRFDGNGEEWPIAMPLQCFLKSGLGLKILPTSRRKQSRPRLDNVNHELCLKR